MNRHARQSRLAGVGLDGQARIARAEVNVALDGLAAEVGARYLAGAGAGRLHVRTPSAAQAARAIDSSVQVEVGVSSPSDEPSPRRDGLLGLRDPVASEVAAGALAALRALRSALQGPS